MALAVASAPLFCYWSLSIEKERGLKLFYFDEMYSDRTPFVHF
jgi:hypothetical protein